MAVLRLKNICKSYSLGGNISFGNSTRYIKAVEDVSFSISKGKTLGLVGESGCGKSTLAKVILKLIEADSGTVFFNETDISFLNEKEFKNSVKGKRGLRSQYPLMYLHKDSVERLEKNNLTPELEKEIKNGWIRLKNELNDGVDCYKSAKK